MKTTKFKAVLNTKTPSGSPIIVAVLKGPDGYEQRVTMRPRQALKLANALHPTAIALLGEYPHA